MTQLSQNIYICLLKAFQHTHIHTQKKSLGMLKNKDYAEFHYQIDSEIYKFVFRNLFQYIFKIDCFTSGQRCSHWHRAVFPSGPAGIRVGMRLLLPERGNCVGDSFCSVLITMQRNSSAKYLTALHIADPYRLKYKFIPYLISHFGELFLAFG